MEKDVEQAAEYPRVGVGVLVFNPEGKVLLGKRLGSHGHGSWAPPGGKLEFGESFDQCGIREAREETGLEITDVEMIDMTNDIYPEGEHWVTIILTAKTTGEPIPLETDKCEGWGWFTLNELPSQLFLTIQNLIKQNPNFEKRITELK